MTRNTIPDKPRSAACAPDNTSTTTTDPAGVAGGVAAIAGAALPLWGGALRAAANEMPVAPSGCQAPGLAAAPRSTLKRPAVGSLPAGGLTDSDDAGAGLALARAAAPCPGVDAPSTAAGGGRSRAAALGSAAAKT